MSEILSLLMHMDGGDRSTAFVDTRLGDPLLGHVFVRSGTPTLSSARSKFGRSAGRFSGAQYIETPDHSDFDLSGGDATIQYWIYLNALAVFSEVLGQDRGGAGNPWFHYYYADGRVGVGRDGLNEIATAAGVMTAGAWHHVAITRAGTTVKVFVDGVQRASATTAVFNDAANTFRVGLNNPANASFDGWIDELEIVKGLARWTATFTPPSRPSFSAAELAWLDRDPWGLLGPRSKRLLLDPSFASGVDMPMEIAGDVGAGVDLPVDVAGLIEAGVDLAFEVDGIPADAVAHIWSIVQKLNSPVVHSWNVVARPPLDGVVHEWSVRELLEGVVHAWTVLEVTPVAGRTVVTAYDLDILRPRAKGEKN